MIFSPWMLKALAIAAALALCVWAVRAYNESLREDGREEIRMAWNKAVQEADQAERVKETQRAEAQRKANDIHTKAVSVLAADAARARHAADGLRGELGRFVASSRCPTGADSAAATGGSPTRTGSDALDLLAGLFSGADAVAGELASALDRSRAAGELCAASYDALTQLSPRTAEVGSASPGLP